MPRKPDADPVHQYTHPDKERANNPPVGLANVETDPASGQVRYQFDPHLDPQLVWAGKAEHTSFDVPTVSLHVHERIDPRTIIEAVCKPKELKYVQTSMFETLRENPPLREAIEFYKHPHNWSNRLIAGDSLLVMNSLLEKEGLAGQVQMIYIDPPYGIKYGSNFQPFVNKRDVKDGRAEDLTQEPEMIKAFRDTWELDIHSYLTYLRDRLLLARELLSESGSVFVQISDENLHLVRNILDEAFGATNHVAVIPFRKKTMPLGTKLIEQMDDYLIWYSRNKSVCRYHGLFLPESVQGDWHYKFAEGPDGSVTELTPEQVANHALLPANVWLFRLKPLEPSGPMQSGMFDYQFEGRLFRHPTNGFGTDPQGMERLRAAKRLMADGNRLAYKLYADDYPITSLTAPWQDTIGPRNKRFAVQTSEEVVQRCLLMTTDPGDLVLDPTCGSGTTARVAEQWGRRWITCDTSRVAITLARQRLMTAVYDYYALAHPDEGVGSGFKYRTAPHIKLQHIANNEPPGQEILYDQPFIDRSKVRISGPFTVEAVPAPTVRSPDEIGGEAPPPGDADATISRSGETLRQAEWRDELARTGIRGRGAQRIEFSRLEPLPGTHWLHADAETRDHPPKRAVISFGPEHAPMDRIQVEHALQEATTLVPRPQLVVFAAFQFDPQAAKDIDETLWPGVTLLRANMNGDLLTDDLKKKRSSNESFWLIGRPDVRLERLTDREHYGHYQVEVQGFDYYNTRSGELESGGVDKIAMWMLDPDYDGRSLFPRQVFFPISGDKDGWSRLARTLKARIDEDLIEAYRGTVSLPFPLGKHKRVAVKIVDDRGIESLRILEVTP